MEKLDPKKDPARRVMKVAAWPKADQLAWAAAITPGDVIEPGGAGATWAPKTRTTVEKCYGRWLAWLERNGLLDAGAPAARVTPEAVGRYIADLRALNASYTVLSRIRNLGFAMKVMAPEQNWDWLQKIVTRLQRCAGAAKDKRVLIHPSEDLFALGLSLMDKADGPDGGSHYQRANDFRDGLLIALLAARPVRRDNLASIEIGRHLVRHAGGYALQFDGAETKNRRPIDVPIPVALVPHVERYLSHYRPFLTRPTGHWRGKRALNSPGNRLWISSYGTAMSQGAIYDRVTKLTEARFGRALSPHLFRDCAATSIAIEDPAHVQMTPNMLGHASLATSEKHYNHARSLQATRSLQQRILVLRRQGHDAASNR